MHVTAQIGFTTTLMETAATSIVTGTVVAGFLAAARGMLLGRARKELEANALSSTFWGGLGGLFCLLYDVIAR